MTDPDLLRVNLLLDKMQRLLRLEPDNVSELCHVGPELERLGRAEDSRKCYRAAVNALRRAIRSADVNRALEWEGLIYTSFVAATEEEEHYRRCFADWKDELAALGERFRDAEPSDGRPNRIAFFLHSGHMLGHTHVLITLLRSRPRTGPLGSEAGVYVLGKYATELAEQVRAAGVKFVSVLDEMGENAALDAKLAWLRKRLRKDRMGVCIWVTVPQMAAFALATRLAPVQIFWSLRFHPISGPPYIDGYITWGGPDESVRRYGDQDWQVVPIPFALDESSVARTAIEEVRSRFAEPTLLGTLAREEKIGSRGFLEAVARTLANNPQAGYLWTGRSEDPGISGYFRDAGVGDRAHFVGWVDTKVYAAALDVFLDTFPHGCGITGYRAFAAGTPVLSYLGTHTMFGNVFWRSAGGDDAGNAPRLAAPDEHAILCARDTEEYVALAGRLVSDPAWRSEVGRRGRAFFEEDLRRNAEYSRRFFETVSRIAEETLRRPAP